MTKRERGLIIQTVFLHFVSFLHTRPMNCFPSGTETRSYAHSSAETCRAVGISALEAARQMVSGLKREPSTAWVLP